MRQVSYSQGYARNKWECAPEWAWSWDGLVGLWVPALGPTGSVLWDVSGMNYPGNCTSLITSATGLYGSVLSFPGGDDTILRGYVLASRKSYVNSQPFSAIVVVNCNALANYTGLVSTLHTPPYPNWVFYTHGDGSFGSYINAHRRTSASEILVNTWYCLAVTFDGSVVTLYKNGIQKHQASGATYTADNTPQNTVIGYFYGDLLTGQGTNHLNGWIALAYVFDRALTSGEVRQIARDPLGPLRLPRRRLWPVSGPIDYPVSFSVARVLSTVPAGIGAAVPALTLSRTQSISEEGIANVVGSLSAGIILALTESGLVQAGDNTILSTVRAITPVGVAGAVDGLTASTVRTVGTDGAAAVQDATALAQIRAFTTEGAVAAADQVVLAIIRAITTGVIVSASDGMTLGEVVTIATTSITAANPTLMVTRLLSVTSNGIAVVTGLAALSQTKSITADGMAIVGPGFGLPGYVSLITTFASTRAIVVLPTVIVPGALVDPERVYEVAVSLREYLLEEVQRSREVTKEERSEIVDIQVDVWW